MIALKTDISDSIDTAPSEVEVEQTQTINEVKFFCVLALLNPGKGTCWSIS
jgi:hypothetical protein